MPAGVAGRSSHGRPVGAAGPCPEGTTMHTTNTLVIGAGHAGLAVSRCLTDRRIDHVVVDRGRLGERWRSARWESFRLLTPNWLTRLPGWAYQGPDPDGFMTASGVQIADELQQAGRRVVLAVGAHTRLPRHYRGRDILWWLERMGSLDRTD